MKGHRAWAWTRDLGMLQGRVLPVPAGGMWAPLHPAPWLPPHKHSCCEETWEGQRALDEDGLPMGGCSSATSPVPPLSPTHSSVPPPSSTHPPPPVPTEGWGPGCQSLPPPAVPPRGSLHITVGSAAGKLNPQLEPHKSRPAPGLALH